MTKKEVIKKAKNSNNMELLLFKTNKNTKKQYLIKHNCLNLNQLEQLAVKSMKIDIEHFYNIEIA